MSGFDWSFFIGFTPVKQSSQEYLGVLLNDSVRCNLRWSHIVGQFSGLSKVYSVV